MGYGSASSTMPAFDLLVVVLAGVFLWPLMIAIGVPVILFCFAMGYRDYRKETRPRRLREKELKKAHRKWQREYRQWAKDMESWSKANGVTW